MTTGQGDGVGWEDGRIEIRYQGKARPHRKIAAAEPKPVVPIRVGEKRRRKSGWKPLASQPWKRPGGSGDDAGHCLRLALNTRPSGSEGYAAAARILGRNLVTKRKKGYFKRGNEGKFLTKVDFPKKAVLTLTSKLNRILLELRRDWFRDGSGDSRTRPLPSRATVHGPSVYLRTSVVRRPITSWFGFPHPRSNP
jgi:hypothetical protein